MKCAAVVMAALLGIGCSFIGAGGHIRHAYNDGAIPDGTKSGVGACADLVNHAESNASLWSVAGWTTGIVGLGALVAGPAMGPDTDANAPWFDKNRNVLVAAGGGLLLLLANSFMKTGDDSATAASAAVLGMLETEDKDKYETCMKAAAAFLEARTSANAPMVEAVKKAQEAETKRAHAEAQLAVAKKLADETAAAKAKFEEDKEKFFKANPAARE